MDLPCLIIKDLLKGILRDDFIRHGCGCCTHSRTVNLVAVDFSSVTYIVAYIWKHWHVCSFDAHKMNKLYKTTFCLHVRSQR